MRFSIACVLSVLFLAGCVDSRRAGTPSDGDAGTRPPSTSAPPGEVAIGVLGAAWLYDGVLVVGVSLANGEGGAPAPQDPAYFDLETLEGAVVGSVSEETTTCSAALSVAAGASLECALTFHPPAGHQPSLLRYEAPDGRSATAPIAACSSSAPGGLCPVGTACDGTSCVAPCSPSNPTGACAGVGEVCVDGYCDGPCSPTRPDGFCEEGSCVDGACDTSCRVVDYSAEGCLPCLEGLSSSGVCAGGEDTCNDSTECGNCLAYGTPTCECFASFACGGCETQMRAVVDCFARECPSCVR